MAYKFYSSEYYRKNKRKFADNAERTRQRGLNFIRNYKKDKFCQICGYKEHTEILEFHHINSKDKKFQLSKTHKSILLLKEEIKKCILLCPNCHKLITNKEKKSYYKKKPEEETLNKWFA